MPRRPSSRDYEQAARLRESIRLFQRASEEIARTHRLTIQRYQLLLTVRTARDGGGSASLAELRGRLQLAQSTVVELVQRAEALGLVRRELSPRNRRATYVALTPEGERRLEGAVAELARHRRRLVSMLSNLDDEA